MVQNSVISADTYFATYKTEHRSWEVSFSTASYCFYSSILRSPYYVGAQNTKGPSFTANSPTQQVAYIEQQQSWKHIL